MAREWTKEQSQVITARNRNLLVSAAAGSGKTAVLVERILRLVTDAEHPVDIDRLLVVTFTNAAAAEMRGRITKALENALTESPEDSNLQKQSILVHNARICTIDSFCQFVISNYFSKIGLEPGFRVVDENEKELLMNDILDLMLEEKYAEAGDDFLGFAESYSADKNDENLKELILNLYKKAMSHPYPREWVEKALLAYSVTEESLEEEPWMQELLTHCRKQTESLISAARVNMVKAEDEGYSGTAETIRGDLERLQGLSECNSYTAYYNSFLQSGDWFARAKSNKKPKEAGEEELALWSAGNDQAKAYRDELKNGILKMGEEFFGQSPAEVVAHMTAAKANAETLGQLCLEFMDRFAREKQEKTMMDFSDMEHYALQILVDPVSKKPTDVALDFANYFYEIMIDEYQDSNEVQELLLTSVSKESLSGESYGHNVFCVGDVKQSIYGFRQARPELFNAKYAVYPVFEGNEKAQDAAKIELHANFRSFDEVLEDMNLLCKPLMRADLGGIDYTEEVQLNPGGTYSSYRNIEDNHTEILMTDGSIEEEARLIAGRILQLMDPAKPMQILEENAMGQLEFRPIRYSDIVVIMRSTKTAAPEMIEVFKEYGIPAFARSNEGFFKSYEIRVMMALLQVIDNPRQDIPYTTLLRSPLVGMSDGELAAIRAFDKEKEKKVYFHEAIENYRIYGDDEEIKGKLNKINDLLADFRKKSSYLQVPDLLQYILQKTCYEELLLAMPAGRKRQANLKLLEEKAISYAKTSYRGLYHFVRYVALMEKQEVDFGEADVLGEKDDVVTFYTMHKSKGLEFPVVFVSGLGKEINMMDLKKRVLLHSDLGIGIEHVDPDKRFRRNTLLKEVVKLRIQKETKGEELRMLYVSATRAKQKLIFTMASKEPEKALADCFENQTADAWGNLSFAKRFSAKHMGDWVLMAYGLMGEKYRPSLIPSEETELAAARAEAKKRFTLAELLAEAALLSAEEVDAYADQYRFSYAFTGEGEIPAKVSVSDVKMEAIKAYDEQADTHTYEAFEHKETSVYVPTFAEDYVEEESVHYGALRGTAVHRVMECYDFTLGFATGSVEAELERMVSEGKLSTEQREKVYPEEFFAFGQSRLAERMQAAAAVGKLFKEQPFVMSLPAREVNPSYDSEQPILIQGIIDAYFEEEDGIVLLDYKTDKVSNAEELIELYRKQLELYAYALDAAGGKKVKEMRIYSFRLREDILL